MGEKGVGLGQVQCLGFAQFTRTHTHTQTYVEKQAHIWGIDYNFKLYICMRAHTDITVLAAYDDYILDFRCVYMCIHMYIYAGAHMCVCIILTHTSNI